MTTVNVRTSKEGGQLDHVLAVLHRLSLVGNERRNLTRLRRLQDRARR